MDHASARARALPATGTAVRDAGRRFRSRAADDGSDPGRMALSQSVLGAPALPARLRPRAQPLRAAGFARSAAGVLPRPRPTAAGERDADRGALAPRIAFQ